MHRSIVFTIAVVIAFTFGSTQGIAQTSPEAAREFIKEISGKAVLILTDQSISLEERESKMREIVSDNVDTQTIGRFAIRDIWDVVGEAERAEYLSLFEVFLVDKYARQFGGYSGQTLRVENSKTLESGNAVVETTILQDGGDNLTVNWLVRDIDGKVKIRDVIIGGKSLARTQRDSFRSILEKDKFAGLLQLLRLRVSKFSAQS